MSASNTTAAVADGLIPQGSRGGLQHKPHEQHGEHMKEGAASKLPTRRLCPSAPQHRYWNHTSSAEASASISRIKETKGELHAASVAANALSTAARASHYETVPSVCLSCAFVSRNTDAAGHTHTPTYATTNAERGNSISSGGTNKCVNVGHGGVEVLSGSCLGATMETKVTGRELLPHSLSSGANSVDEINTRLIRSKGAAKDTSEMQGLCNSYPVRHSNLIRSSAYAREYNHGVMADRLPANGALSKENVSGNNSLPSSQAPVNPAAPEEKMVAAAPQQFISPLATTTAIGSARVPSLQFDLTTEMDGDALSTRAEPYGHADTSNSNNYKRLTPSDATTRIPASQITKDAQLATPETAQSALPPSETATDCNYSIVQHSCSLTRLMQCHQQEGWRAALKAALQQDVGVWVRQVCEEQHLLRAQLMFTQAKVAELTREVQLLRGEEQASVYSEFSSQFRKTRTTKKPDRATTFSNESSSSSGSSDAADATSPPDEATDALKDHHAAELVCSPAYRLNMETYIHSLETHTRTLHDEKQQLQLRLDKRTSQLALAHRRYKQNYAMLLHEQSILESDYQKATADVEEVVGMLVVARAAEQAALRRLGEYELALEEAAQQMEEMRRGLEQPPRCKHDDKTEETNMGEKEVGVAASPHPPLQLPPPAPPRYHPSLSSSTYYTCVEANDADSASVTTAAASTSSPLYAFNGRNAVLPLLSGSEITTSISNSPTQHTPPLRTSPSHQTPLAPSRKHSTAFISQAETRHQLSRSLPIASLPLTTDHANSAAVAHNETHNASGAASSTSASFSISETPCPAGGVAATLAAPLPLLPLSSSNTVGGADASEVEEGKSNNCTTNNNATSSSFPHSPAKNGSRFLTPIASSLAALLTPRSLRSISLHMTTATTTSAPPVLHDAQVSFVKDVHGAPDERELLRFKCTLLELELQEKEKQYTEERDKWASAVYHAEGVHTVMGEVEAHVQQVNALSSKVKGLLHEMNRLWCTSLALENQCDSEEEDVLEEAREYSPLTLVEEEERHLRPRYSCDSVNGTATGAAVATTRASASLLEQIRQNSSETLFRGSSRPSLDNASSGREFFGIERPFVF